MTKQMETVKDSLSVSSVNTVLTARETQESMQGVYDQTLGLYVAVYGRPDERVWPNMVAICGASYLGLMPRSDEMDHENADPFE